MSFPIRAKASLLGLIAAPLLMPTNSEAVLVIAGVTDGDLPGGYPKAVILQAGADVADLSMWGVGAANNGGGTDGQEFTFPAGSAAAGDVFVIAGTPDSFDFFANNFVQDFNLYLSDGGSGAANVNGDDAIELFFNGAVFDTFGEIDVDGTGQPWEYTDGYVIRNPGAAPGAFNLANYTIAIRAFDTLNEAQHVAVFVGAGFTAVPEPGVAGLLLLGACVFLRRRR